MKKVISLGELLIDFVPTENGKNLKEVEKFIKFAGGAPANVSSAVAYLGGNAYMIGKVGNDPFGEFLVETIRSKGVNSDYVLNTIEAKTSLAFVSLQSDGERDFMFYREPSADMLLHQDDIQSKWFHNASIFHFGSISLINSPFKEATLKAINFAKQNNLLISYDPNIRLPLWPNENQAREEITNQVQEVDLLKLSEEELFFLTGIEEEQKAVLALTKGRTQLVIITKGKEGCTYYTKNSIGRVNAHTVEAIDATGAGDAFVGGLLYMLSKELAQKEDFQIILNNKILIENILNFANVCGALTTTKRGAISSLPSLEEVLLKIRQIESSTNN